MNSSENNDVHDMLFYMLQNVLDEMKYSIKDNIKINSVDMSMLKINDKDVQYAYFEKHINKINSLIFKFNESNELKRKEHYMNIVKSMIYFII